MPDPKSSLESITQSSEVRQALSASTGEPAPPVEVKPVEKLQLGAHALVLAGLAGVHWLLRAGLIAPAKYGNVLQRATTGAIIIVLMLAGGSIVRIYLIGRVADSASRYNLNRILKLLIGLATAASLISLVFANWYTAFVSLGLISLILGFALQTPITSFIGWIYILARAPYRVGDRIEIDHTVGDVIDVSYLDTT